MLWIAYKPFAAAENETPDLSPLSLVAIPVVLFRLTNSAVYCEVFFFYLVFSGKLS